MKKTPKRQSKYEIKETETLAEKVAKKLKGKNEQSKGIFQSGKVRILMRILGSMALAVISGLAGQAVQPATPSQPVVVRVVFEKAEKGEKKDDKEPAGFVPGMASYLCKFKDQNTEYELEVDPYKLRSPFYIREKPSEALSLGSAVKSFKYYQPLATTPYYNVEVEEKDWEELLKELKISGPAKKVLQNIDEVEIRSTQPGAAQADDQSKQ